MQTSNIQSARMILNTNLGGGRHGESQLESEDGTRGYIEDNEEMEDELMGRYQHNVRFEGQGGDMQQEYF